MNNSMFVNPGKPDPMMGGGGFGMPQQQPNWAGAMGVAGDALGGFAPGTGQRPDWLGRMGGTGQRPAWLDGMFGGQFQRQPMGFSPQGGFGGGGYQADPFAFAPMQHDPRVNGFAR